MQRISPFESKPDTDKAFSSLVAWVQENDGFVDHRLALGFGKLGRGIFAREAIENGTVLLRCPWQLIIGSRDAHQSDDGCKIIRTLDRELRLGRESFWYPYLRSVGTVDARLPTLWDDHTLGELQGLPPCDATRHIDWFTTECRKGQSDPQFDAIVQQAFLCYLTRASDRGMVPVYDLLNHHNGDLNTAIEITENGLGIKASRVISRGDEVYNSYGLEPTSNLFRDYGFVESWPQSWFWTDAEEKTHRFAWFSDDRVMIEPPEELVSELATQSVPREAYGNRVSEHNRALSRETLERFAYAAQALVRGLPTTPEEDARIAEALEAERYQNPMAENKRRDLLICVQYRWQFKESIESALRVSHDLISLKED